MFLRRRNRIWARSCTNCADALSGQGYAVVLAVPFDDPSWPYRSYADVTDFILLMGYDQHWEGGEPGSIADQSWFEKTLDKRMQDLDPARTIIAIGGYGYDWVEGSHTVELSFQEAVLSAKDSDANIDFDPNTSNPQLLLCRSWETPRRLVSGRRHRLQRDPRGRRLSAGRICVVAPRIGRSFDLVGDGSGLWRSLRPIGLRTIGRDPGRRYRRFGRNPAGRRQPAKRK